MVEVRQSTRPDFHYIQVFACTSSGLFGREGGLPWSYPEDLAYFKELTSGPEKAVLMGYKTWESLPVGVKSGEKLVGRKKFVVTRKKGLKPLKDTIFINSYSRGVIMDLAQSIGLNTVYIIGGAEILNHTVYERTGISLSFIVEPIEVRLDDVFVSKNTFRGIDQQSNFVRDLVPGKVKLYQLGVSEQNTHARRATVLRTLYDPAFTMDNDIRF
jgi:dihydrofolate reductase